MARAGLLGLSPRIGAACPASDAAGRATADGRVEIDAHPLDLIALAAFRKARCWSRARARRGRGQILASTDSASFQHVSDAEIAHIVQCGRRARRVEASQMVRYKSRVNSYAESSTLSRSAMVDTLPVPSYT
jgi:hypothetical protein